MFIHIQINKYKPIKYVIYMYKIYIVIFIDVYLKISKVEIIVNITGYSCYLSMCKGNAQK